jgi:hypothetical protein
MAVDLTLGNYFVTDLLTAFGCSSSSVGVLRTWRPPLSVPGQTP